MKRAIYTMCNLHVFHKTLFLKKCRSQYKYKNTIGEFLKKMRKKTGVTTKTWFENYKNKSRWNRSTGKQIAFESTKLKDKIHCCHMMRVTFGFLNLFNDVQSIRIEQ